MKMTRRVLAILAAILGIAAAFPRSGMDVSELAREVTAEEDHVTALELAQWIRDRKPGLRIVDLQPKSATTRVPHSESMSLEAAVRARFQPNETIVLISDGGGHAAQAWVLLRSTGLRHVYFLRGGLAEWNATVLHPEKSTELTRYFRRDGC